MKIGDEVLIHGYVDEIRKDTIIIKNDGGYFGTVKNEIIPWRYQDNDYPQDLEDVIVTVEWRKNEKRTVELAIYNRDSDTFAIYGGGDTQTQKQLFRRVLAWMHRYDLPPYKGE